MNLKLKNSGHCHKEKNWDTEVKDGRCAQKILLLGIFLSWQSQEREVGRNLSFESILSSHTQVQIRYLNLPEHVYRLTLHNIVLHFLGVKVSSLSLLPTGSRSCCQPGLVSREDFSATFKQMAYDYLRWVKADNLLAHIMQIPVRVCFR